MKKKLLAIMSAVVLIIGTTVTAYAAPSPSVGTVGTASSGQTTNTTVEQEGTPTEYSNGTTVSGGFTDTTVSTTTAQSAAVATQNLVLNNVAATGALLGRTDIANAATNSGATVTASILTVVDIQPTAGQTKDANGYYTFTLAVAGISAGDAIIALHYNGTAWETIVPNAVGDGAVEISSTTCSPFAIVKLTVDTAASAGATAPKTGETLPLGVVVVVAALACSVVCGRKFFATEK